MNATFESSDDKRVGNSPTRHQYRVLSDAEKQTMSDIKDAGEQVLVALNKANEKAIDYAVVLQSLDNTEETRIALHRLFSSMDMSSDDIFLGSKLVKQQIIHIKESVMWAVRGLTA